MKSKKLKICILDENDNILKSSKIVIKWSNEIEEDMIKFHNIKAEEEVINMLFSNIINKLDDFATEEDWKEIRSE